MKPSRYYRFKQTDGRGFMIVKLDDSDVTKGTILHINMTSETADDHVEALRVGERQADRGAS